MAIWFALPFLASVASLLFRIRIHPFVLYIVATAIGCVTVCVMLALFGYADLASLEQFDLDGNGSVSEGEMTIEQAKEEQKKVKIKKQAVMTSGESWELLPDELKGMIERSVRLQEQVLHFDEALSTSEKVAVQDGNPLAGHINLLEEAFGS